MACAPSSRAGEDVFRMAITAEPPTLDWSLATDNVSFDILTNIMEGLTQYNADLEPIPSIAKRWEFSKDGKVITYYLREDVLWTDGRPVTARDFEYSWKRLLNPATAAEYAYFLFDVENAYEYNSGKIKDADRVGVRATAPFVLQVKLKRPVVYFPSITTFMVTFPQRKDIIERYGERWTDPDKIVTNGPFTLDEWRHEYKVVLRANPNYYGPKPGMDKVVAYVVEEATTALTLYETGELDMVELPPVAIPHYRDHPEYMNSPILRGYYYGFNIHKPPFDNALARRAFAHAIDRSRIPAILQGGESPTASWIPKGMFGFNAAIGPRFNPEKARTLLAQAGYPGGKGFPPVTAVYNTDQTNRLIAEFVQAQWRQHLGVNVELESQEWKVFLSRLKTDPPQIFRLGWGADFPDPDNFMNLFVSSSGNNHLQWSNRRYDELVARGASERDLKKRQAIYDEAQRVLTEIDVPMISLFLSTQNLLVKPYIGGLEVNAMELLYLKKLKPKTVG
ncbi:MAG: peptide ABC transporter substrate-binding protein [Nitrospinales bacterium]